MTLGHKLKGLLMNYALATRQKFEIAAAKEKEALVDKNLASIEQDVAATKEKLMGKMETLKADYEEKVSKLVKDHEEELAKAKKDQKAALKTSNVLQEDLSAKEEGLATLAKDNEAALFELASLRQEKEKWESEKETLEETIWIQYDEASCMCWSK
jgi:paraquat-inducible protein B